MPQTATTLLQVRLSGRYVHTMSPKLKSQLRKLIQSDLLVVLLGAVVLEVIFLSLALSTVSVPGEIVVHGGLREIIYVFEG